jgi:hypothetical protein
MSSSGPRCFRAFMKLLATDLAEVGQGWRSTGNRDGFGTDYRFRTVANFAGIWWNSASEVIYYALQADETGHPPTGDHHYAIRFAADESPGEHVDGYWSMTLYSHPDVRLVPNPIGVYSISYRTRAHPRRRRRVHHPHRRRATCRRTDLQLAAIDGPGEAWTLVLRLYLPRADVLNATWSPPAMTIER